MPLTQSVDHPHPVDPNGHLSNRFNPRQEQKITKLKNPKESKNYRWPWELPMALARRRGSVDDIPGDLVDLHVGVDQADAADRVEQAGLGEYNSRFVDI
jgi:hypothetical protein